MSATIIDENRVALEERVDAGGRALNEALSKLAETLGAYGFKGKLKLGLVVEVDGYGYDKDVVLKRSTMLRFKR